VPAIKASYLCYATNCRKEMLLALEQRSAPEEMQREPTLENYVIVLNAFIDKAKKNVHMNYL
jgi:hypothetical protein